MEISMAGCIQLLFAKFWGLQYKSYHQLFLSSTNCDILSQISYLPIMAEKLATFKPTAPEE